LMDGIIRIPVVIKHTNPSKQQIFASGQYAFRSRDFDFRLKLDGSMQEIQNKGMPVVNPYSAYAFDDYYFTNRFDVSMFNEYRMNNNSKLTFTNSFSLYNHIKNTYRKNMVDLSQDLVSTLGTQDTSNFNSWLFRGAWSNVNPFHRATFQTGYDINLDRGTGIKLLNNLQHIYDFALFGSIDYKLNEQLNLRPGLRFTYNTRYGAPLVPSLNILFKPKNNLTARLGYARGFRSPSLKELDLYFIDANHNIRGNENLKAETSNSIDASITLQNTSEDLPLKFEVDGFFNDIHNIITLALVDDVSQLFTYINLDHYQTAGINFSATLSNSNYTFNTGFEMLGTYNSLSESNADVSHFSLSPQFQNNFVWHLIKLKLDAAVYFKNVGTTPGYALDAKNQVYETFIQPYNIIDLSLNKKIWGDRLKVNVGVKNLLNVINISTNTLGDSPHSSNDGMLPYAMGRYYFASFHLNFYKQ